MNKACPTGEELHQLDRSLDIQPKKRGGQEKIPIWEDKEEVDKWRETVWEKLNRMKKMPETVDVKVMSDDEFLKKYKGTFKKERHQFKNYYKDCKQKHNGLL